MNGKFVLVLFFLLEIWCTAESTPIGKHGGSSENKPVSSEARERNNDRKTARIRAQVSRAIGEMKANEYRCPIGQYWATTGSCEDCVELCTVYNQKMCEIECPVTYVEYVSGLNKMKEDITASKLYDKVSVKHDNALIISGACMSTLILATVILVVLAFVKLRTLHKQTQALLNENESLNEKLFKLNSKVELLSPPNYSSNTNTLRSDSTGMQGSLPDKGKNNESEQHPLIRTVPTFNAVPPEEGCEHYTPGVGSHSAGISASKFRRNGSMGTVYQDVQENRVNTKPSPV
uniref:TNFR-Cys domain-containing protein n=1 Tax=Ciona intestinalis TaxID=7719 RepID=F7BA68_CIOIN